MRLVSRLNTGKSLLTTAASRWSGMMPKAPLRVDTRKHKLPGPRHQPAAANLRAGCDTPLNHASAPQAHGQLAVLLFRIGRDPRVRLLKNVAKFHHRPGMAHQSNPDPTGRTMAILISGGLTMRA